MANIYLVGFMGTGKTAVGREVARQLNQQFIDLDSRIEKGEGKKISQIFSEEGEAYFRNLEKQALKQIAAGAGWVVSCGGGIILDNDNIRMMKETGSMVCLTSRPQVILMRTQAYGHRPLLNVDNPAEKIEELLKMRAPFYAQADYTIDTSDLTIAEVVNKVLTYVRGKNA
ncbi:shikimate kinase [Candidatus Omnitrophota bacterium]